MVLCQPVKYIYIAHLYPWLAPCFVHITVWPPRDQYHYKVTQTAVTRSIYAFQHSPSFPFSCLMEVCEGGGNERNHSDSEHNLSDYSGAPPYGYPWNMAIYDNADTLLGPEHYLHRLTCNQTHWNVDMSLFREVDTWLGPNSITAYTKSPS